MVHLHRGLDRLLLTRLGGGQAVGEGQFVLDSAKGGRPPACRPVGGERADPAARGLARRRPLPPKRTVLRDADRRRSGQLPPKDPDYINPVGLRPPYRSKRVVIAVHGGTKYLGHELFLASDIRVAADDTVFSQGEVARGVFPGGGATVRFPREAGWGNAMRYMLTGDEWGAPEAYRLGLVQEVTPPGKELDRAIDLANKIAAAAPLGVRATLTSSRQALAADEATALAALQAEFGRLLQSEDAKEFQRALQEGRAPLYRGL